MSKSLKHRPIILIRAEASADIGIGHLMRTLALAQQLKKKGHWDIRFLLKKEAIALLGNKGQDLEVLEVPANEPAELQWLKSLKIPRPLFFLADSYLLSASYFEQLRLTLPGTLILAFDDQGEKIPLPVHGLINFSLTAGSLNYPDEKTYFSLLGPVFYPLREEFLAAKAKRSWARKEGLHLAITMGGADPDQEGRRILRVISQHLALSKRLHKITFVVGPAFSQIEELKKTASLLPQVELVFSPPNLCPIFDAADIVVSAAGSTCHELAYRGVPSALISLSSDQVLLAKAMAKKQAAVWLGHFTELSDASLAQGLLSFVEDQEKYPELSQKAQALIDGKGAERVRDVFLSWQEHFHETRLPTEHVRDLYESSAHEENDFAKVRWGSQQGMINGLEVCFDHVPWDQVTSWLDVGSGTGDCYAHFRAQGKKVARYLGLDLSASLCQLAAKKNSAYPEASFECVDFFEPRNEQYSLVTAIGVLQNCGSSLFKAMGRLADLVEDGGLLFLTTKNLDWKEFENGLTPEPLHLWFKEEELIRAMSFSRLKILLFRGFEPRTKEVVEPSESHSVFILAQKERA